MQATTSPTTPPTTPLNELCKQALHNNNCDQGIEFEKTWYGWNDIRRVAIHVSQLIDQCGAGDHPRVAFVARNRPSSLAAFLGMLSKNCSVRMVYPFQSAESLAKELSSTNAAVVVAAEEDFAEPILEVVKQHQLAAIGLTEMQSGFIAGCETTSSPQPNTEHREVILLTSGTTGKPKPFPISYEKIAQYFTGNPGKPIPKVAEPADDTPALLYFPVSNISGLYSTLPPLLSGKPIVLLDRFKLELWLDFVRRFQPKISGLPPAAFKMLLDARIPKQDLASIKVMSAGAAPLDPAIQAEFIERYQTPILLSYGATEFGGPVVGMTLDLWQQFGKAKIGSVGRPYPGMKVRIVDPNKGTELPAGKEGIVEVVSRRIGPEWIRTSDIALLDNDGFLFLKGRADGAIIRGGFKLVPAVIEEALLKNPKVAMASVIGVPDQRLGQVPAAAIVLKSNAGVVDVAEIEHDLRTHVPATYIPKIWKFIDELPRTPSMKVDMPAVRRLFAESV